MWNKNEPENNIWRTRDVAEIAAAMKTAPIFIDEIKSNFHNFVKVLFCFNFISKYNRILGTSVPGGPIGGQTNIQLRNEHLSYILTW